VAEALYRKWRPQTFDDVVGQEHITTTLRNQIATNRVGHAYLFVGSRGCGKTTTARILAKEINIAGIDPNSPRAKQIADSISEGRELDLIEIDAASHTGVDDIREIRDKVAFQPSELRYKVYIIDEVHMLSTSAFNALLKTLEEPPSHVVFILATTDPQKIPATVLSRCQRFNFKRVPVKRIVDRLRVVCQGEGIEADDHALTLIARQATGALRDAISLLDQLASSNSLRITADDVREALGATDVATVRALMDGLVTGNPAVGLDGIQAAIDQGADARQIARQMVDYLRSVLQIKLSQKDTQGPTGEISESEKLDLTNYSQKAGAALLLHGIRAFSTAISEMRSTVDSQLFLEMAYLECAIADELAEAHSQQVAEPSQRAVPTSTRGAAPKAAHAEPAAPQAGTAPSAGVTPPASTSVPANPAAASDGGGVSLETLRAQWKAMIQQVNSTNKPTAALLRSCHPVALEGDAIRIKADHDLIRQRLDDPKHHEVMTTAINQLLNGTFIVHVFTGAPDQEADAGDDPVIKAGMKLGGKIREE
jgi:DNA polymerase-3 subunit gamma/tau